MMSSKATSAVSGRGSPSGRSGVDPRSFFFSANPPFPSGLLGLSCAEAGPSGATSATRYDRSECVVVVPVVVAELELVDVKREISRAYLMEVPDDAPLNQRPEAFNVLGVNRADDILPLGVVDNLVRVILVQPAIANPLVGNQQAYLFGYCLPDKSFERVAIDTFDYASGNLALAADRADDRGFAGANTTSPSTLPALTKMTVLRETADECFINLDLAEQLPLGAALHRDAEAMAHIPSRLVRAGAEHPMDLERAHTLFGVVHQERDLEPLDQRIFRVLEDRPADNREPIAVLVAPLAPPMERARLDGVDFRVAAARAIDAIGPTPLSEERLAIIFGLEPGDELGEGHARFHGGKYRVSDRMVSSAG